MRNFLTLVLVGLMGLATPVMAQTVGEQGGPSTPPAPDGFAQSPITTVANGPYYAQAPSGSGDQDDQNNPNNPFGNISPWLIIGGVAGGAGLIAYAISQNNNSNAPVSP